MTETMYAIFPNMKLGTSIKGFIYASERVVGFLFKDGYKEYLDYQKWAARATEEELAASEAAGAAISGETEEAVEETAEESTEVSETEEAAAEDTSVAFWRHRFTSGTNGLNAHRANSNPITDLPFQKWLTKYKFEFFLINPTNLDNVTPFEFLNELKIITKYQF